MNYERFPLDYNNKIFTPTIELGLGLGLALWQFTGVNEGPIFVNEGLRANEGRFSSLIYTWKKNHVK